MGFRVETVSIYRLSDSDWDAWVLREFSREWITSLVVRKAINVNVDESKSGLALLTHAGKH